MEGFAAAVACKLAGVPLSIIRGISNRAGYRDLSRWKVKEALEAAAELLSDSLVCPSRSPAVRRVDPVQDTP
jgi:futalosine hydrolase